MRSLAYFVIWVLFGVMGPHSTDEPLVRLRVAELLLQKNVQTELRLTSEQTQKLQALDLKLQARLKKVNQEIRKLPPTAAKEYLQKQIQQINNELKTALASTLTSAQQQRLSQIGYQQIGYKAFFDSVIQRRLHLTKEQQLRLQRIHSEHQQEAKRLWEEAKGEAEKLEARSKRLRALLQEGARRMQQTFDTEQRVLWKRIIGEPFRFE